ncbi:E3 ubiquitin-protein ligase RNF217 isoform X4 [Pipistrellus kuhlii]|uniref:E3 ubiquitin-protein ligase RNF217 isoform X4 n=1 Tax=Pipistrellus kuhlii TaxID=59472 RepID=UPI001E2727C4|nr:E3 ubiquitin-protein ligase RNF217 isoform X4 [Pipistrellus kuhlii]
MGEEQSTVSGGGGAPEPGHPAAGSPEPPRPPRGDGGGAPGPPAASPDPGGGGCGNDSGCAATGAPEPAGSWGAPGCTESRRAPAPPAGLAPLNPRTLPRQLEERQEEEEAGNHRKEEGGREPPPGEEPPPGARVGSPDALVLDVLGQRRPPAARRQVFCSVFCVENVLPPDPAAEPLPPPPAEPPRAPPPVMDAPGTPSSSLPSPRPALPAAARLPPDGGGGGGIELEFYLAPEPFSAPPRLLGAPPYPGLGGAGDPYAPLMVLMCRVCLEDKPIKPLPCCKKAVCEECLKVYLSSQIQCPACQFVWCFKCHSPWHEGVNCKEYKKGDKLLRHWASEIEHGQRNAQKCPKCKIHIQRTEGCDHMTCSQCNTNFCYRCGERYRQLRFFGDHTSNLSIFGCKYRYLPERPHLRRFVRGSVCAGKLFVAPLILVLGLALGAIAVVIGLFVFPIYCLCKKQRKRSRTGMHW